MTDRSRVGSNQHTIAVAVFGASAPGNPWAAPDCTIFSGSISCLAMEDLVAKQTPLLGPARVRENQ